MCLGVCYPQEVLIQFGIWVPSFKDSWRVPNLITVICIYSNIVLRDGYKYCNYETYIDLHKEEYYKEAQTFVQRKKGEEIACIY